MDQIIQTLLGYGPNGVLLAIVFFLGRYLFNAKKIFDGFVEFIETHKKESETLTSTLKSIDSSLVEINKSQHMFVDSFSKHSADDAKTFAIMHASSEDIKDRLNDLKSAGNGNLTETQVSNLVGVYSGKVHAQIMLWFDNRCQHNHILESPHLVRQRYTDRFMEVISKWKSELSQFRFNGLPLDRFDGGGLLVFYTEIFKTIYDIQLSIAKGIEPSYKREQLQDYFDRKQSVLMGASRVWCSSGKTLLDTIKDSPLDGQISENIHWLTDEYKSFEGTDPLRKTQLFE